ncbi:MAG: helix-turn-helix transcriptional regulator [Firmicutes bacterium]|nr:helix-turn-helix transcriptional regulator [Bacillota bacterium]
MEFNEKLQELRKNKDLTQEELAEILYVSRTAVSKWESGKGLPSIDSLRSIAEFFSVTLDELLSGDAILSMAKKEKADCLSNVCNMLSAITDLLSFLFIILPLYPENIGGYFYSVNLIAYSGITHRSLVMYWLMFVLLIAAGILRLIFINLGFRKCSRIFSDISIVLSIILVAFLALSREAYATTLALVLLVVKGLLLLKAARHIHGE